MTQILTTAEVKKAAHIDRFLASMGILPDPKMSNNRSLFYLSPLRNEKTPSFKVDLQLNLWYDHGIGKGGSVIDLVMAIHACSLSEALAKLTHFVSFHRPTQAFSQTCIQSSTQLPFLQPNALAGEKRKIIVVSARPLSAPALLRYLGQRSIPLDMAGQYCKEVIYELGGHRYYAIGFPNNAGGYELRNPYFKGSSSPKGSTFLDRKADEVAVFEGFFSFLSYQTLNQVWQNPESNYLVLNSLSFVESSKPLMERHTQVNLYLDQDDAGRNRTKELTVSNSLYKDCSSIYQVHKDLNGWLVHLHKEYQSLEHARKIASEINHIRNQDGKPPKLKL
ncbi:CHC2 zinc finger domain-containing protein [Paraflavitalea sp. CAU 1676]|uniref:CHC2 zinc finger domain-containing protein n=1 Tax=Paraflavitalea sp. CAU 1676 TaxID=3032598 RepID=UPI0023DAD57E|nr:CHC2 zinc finger domain-containing protein [Paraflavitalea sp. CAU 1676]MDF2189831.1 CHC2 zinc finger domain-containing protein [Paraflavitalea sp. CAU 1676]